jgi:16S rRNA (adenine1518-N6/adenine1519-N6)-dimethyltransferase
VEILEGDVLQVNFANLVARKPAPLLGPSLHPAGEEHERALVVGNLPYYITSDILLHLLASHEWLEMMVVMVQREVADRIVSKPGSRNYGLLSATVQLFTRVEKLFTLPPGAFSPPPKVHSSVLRLTVAPRAGQLKVDADDFLDFLKGAFAQKRKTLVNNLKARYKTELVIAALARNGVRKDARAEALSLEQMAGIYRHLSAY